MKMLAAILKKPGKIELEEIKVPEISKSEILVKVQVALTCGTDLKAYKRGHKVIPMPGLFGHEFSGTIVKKGRYVKKFKEGDDIMTVHSAPCFACPYCKKELFNLCNNIMKTKILGAFSEYIVIPEHILKVNTFHKPKNVSFIEAAFLEPLSCVVHGIRNIDIKEDDNVIVIGAGPIGLLHLLVLKMNNPRLIMVDKHLEKLKVAKKLGADHVLLSSHTKHHKEIADIGFDYVFECTGTVDVWEDSINLVRRGGTVILFGGCPSGTKVSYSTERIHYDEITLKGVFHFTPSDVKYAYEILCERKVNVSGLISGIYSLKEVRKAFEMLAEGKGIKYAIIP
jgi:L-iditol 2-dehydrogenase